MGLFNIFKKKETTYDKMQKLLSIPCDYDGYDIVFREGKTDPETYKEFFGIITNFKINLDEISSYELFLKERSVDTFYEFYNDLLQELVKDKFVFHWDNSSIEEFVEAMEDVSDSCDYNIKLDKSLMINHYKEELKQIDFDENYRYEILQANVIAEELRNHKLELINLFDGFSNVDFTMIPISKIEELKELENRIMD